MLSENSSMLKTAIKPQAFMKQGRVIESKLVNNSFLTQKMKLVSVKAEKLTVRRTQLDQNFAVSKKKDTALAKNLAWPFAVSSRSY